MVGVFSISPLKSGCFLEKTFPENDLHLNITYNNTEIGLSKFYNNIIETKYKEYDTIILCHHDVSLEYLNIDAVIKGLEQFDIIGVAGGLNPKIIEKNLWHWMMEKENYRGIAGHSVNESQLYVTSFGPTPSRVAILDGVFLAFDPKNIYNSGARFDENFLWHHYDIDFSLTCNLKKLKLGVWPILVNHQSPGLRDLNNKLWNQSNEYFRNKWNERRK